MNKPTILSRRNMLKTTALAATALPLVRFSGSPLGMIPDGSDPWHGLKVGVASYTLRKMPLDAAIKAIQRVGLKYVSIKDFHLPMKSTAEERLLLKFKDPASHLSAPATSRWRTTKRGSPGI
jgi:hypothetical protein